MLRLSPLLDATLLTKPGLDRFLRGANHRRVWGKRLHERAIGLFANRFPSTSLLEGLTLYTVKDRAFFRRLKNGLNFPKL